jgi:hypothetical protein
MYSIVACRAVAMQRLLDGRIYQERVGKHGNDMNAIIEELCFLYVPFRDVMSKG